HVLDPTFGAPGAVVDVAEELRPRHDGRPAGVVLDQARPPLTAEPGRPVFPARGNQVGVQVDRRHVSRATHAHNATTMGTPRRVIMRLSLRWRRASCQLPRARRELPLTVLVDGALTGALYAPIALAFVVVYRASGVINFALGEWTMLGA